jgi:hypothetical protein
VHPTPHAARLIGDRTDSWRIGCVPPLPELMVLGELAQAAASNDPGIDLTEAGLALG